MQWTENLSTGVDEIDEQHKRLFKSVDNAIISIIKTKNEIYRNEPLAELRKSFEDHFGEQEELMRKIKFTGFVQHQFEHQRFLKELDHYNDILYMDSVNANINQIRIFVMQWLVKHIAMQDKDFGRFYLQHMEED